LRKIERRILEVEEVVRNILKTGMPLGQGLRVLR
jgi:hypothetical protein